MECQCGNNRDGRHSQCKECRTPQTYCACGCEKGRRCKWCTECRKKADERRKVTFRRRAEARKKEAERKKTWREHNALQTVTMLLYADTVGELDELAKRKSVSRNELVATFVQWGVENEQQQRRAA